MSADIRKERYRLKQKRVRNQRNRLTRYTWVLFNMLVELHLATMDQNKVGAFVKRQREKLR